MGPVPARGVKVGNEFCADSGMDIARATRMVASAQAGVSFCEKNGFILLKATTRPETGYSAAKISRTP